MKVNFNQTKKQKKNHKIIFSSEKIDVHVLIWKTSENLKSIFSQWLRIKSLQQDTKIDINAILQRIMSDLKLNWHVLFTLIKCVFYNL